LVKKKLAQQNGKLENWEKFRTTKSDLTGEAKEAVATTRVLRPITAIVDKKEIVSHQVPIIKEIEAVSKDIFGEKEPQNEKVETPKDTPDDVNQPEVIATCEEILEDMKVLAGNLQDCLRVLDGLQTTDFIDEINNILAHKDLIAAEHLIWEFEDYARDFPGIFLDKKYSGKKDFFKKNMEKMKIRLNDLLEEELEAMTEDYQLETQNIDFDSDI